MKKVSVHALVLVLLISTAICQNAQPLRFQYGNSQASLTRTPTGYNGVLRILSNGGTGGYNYFISGLPSGWTADGNVITIPNIINVVGSYIVKARVSDSNGNVLESDLRLVIRGVNVFIQANINNGSNTMNATAAGQSNATSGGISNNVQYTYSTSNQETINGGSSSSTTNILGINPNNFRSGTFSGTIINPIGNKVNTNNNVIGGQAHSAIPIGIQARAQDVNANVSLISLYQSYPGLPSGSIQAPPNGRYPTPSPSPVGPPSLPNTVPSVISMAQAQYSSARDSSAITIQEVKRNAAFNRQLFANKAVANLIAIIQQLTANVNAARNDIVILQKQLKDAETGNQQCNSRIYDLSNTRTKIQNAIKDRQDKIMDTNQKVDNLTPSLKELNNGKENLIKRRTQIENARSPNAAKLSDLQRQLKNSTSAKQKLQRQLDGFNTQIQGLGNDIKKTQEDAASAPGSIELINQQIPIVENKIDQLQKLLKNAQREKSKLLEDRDNYQRAIESANKKIVQIQKSVKQIQAKLPDLQNQIMDANNDSDQIQKQIDQFRNQISQKEADYKILADQISTQQALTNGKSQQIKKLNNNVANFPAQIIALQQEYERIQQIVSRQYYICNDAADAVRAAKQNVQAMNTKYETQSNWLREANNNLERARAEKQLADQGIQEIISSSTSALPFSIIPNGNGLTPRGSPSGNNPSGSPLGPVPDRNQVPPGSPVVVGDLRTYLSQAYGAGVDPSRPSTVTTLYPLSILTIQALTGQSTSGIFNPDGSFASGVSNGLNQDGANILSSFTCSGTSGLTQGQGRVISLQPGQIVVAQQNGNPIVLKVAPCSNLNAIQKNVSIVPKTPIYFKGVQYSPGQVNLQQLTCV